MPRAFSFALRLTVLSALLAMVAVVAAACGRSDLPFGVLPEGGLSDVNEEGDSTQPDGPSCNASTCPKGCCSASGECLNGAAIDACGTGGEACQNCQAEGFEFCYETTQACGNAVNDCGPTNCKGCCVGGVCLAGTDPTECGVGGGSCTNCQSQGQTCNGGQCSSESCAPGNCNGCCAGNSCLPGTAPTECGVQGLPCDDCTKNGMTCNSFGQCTTATSCNAQNCGKGCCDGNVCVGGTSSNACGFGGQPCQNCQSFGETCQGQTCQGGTQCNAQNCGFGCCEGNTCVPGTSSNACGFGGQPCQNCQGFGESCQGQVCTFMGTCNAQTCPGGCCLGGACIPGTLDNACGFGGQACQNCQSFGEVCQGQICEPAGGCNANNCFGCCQGNVCVPGTLDTQCGFDGGQCANCTLHGETCQGQQCLSACNPNNCQGCCDTNQMCQPGFLDNECGGFGQSCVNCTTLNPPSTCNGSLFPPQCASQQMSCPSPYQGCFAQPEQVPTPVTACSSTDLQNAAAACAGGAETASCQNFFNFEFSQNAACGQCLSPFDLDFADQQGIFECIADFVSAACNQSDACTYDCTTQSCGSCSDTTTYDTCRTNVDSATGQCSKFQGSSSSCEQSAYSNGAAFCNPANYANFGAWLQGVGAHYCDMGPIVDGGFGGG